MLPHPSSPTLLAFLLGAVSGCAAESNAGASSDSCTAQIDRFATRVAECRTLTSEQRETAIAQCESAISAADPRDAWRPGFQKAVDDCSATLTCEDYAENAPDAGGVVHRPRVHRGRWLPGDRRGLQLLSAVSFITHVNALAAPQIPA
jgi:hypothetical protein